MKVKLLTLWAASLALLLSSCDTDENAWLKRGIETAKYQLLAAAPRYLDSIGTPRSIKKGKVRLAEPEDWTSGFFPGILWLAHELTGDQRCADFAKIYTEKLDRIQYYRGTHDLGFMMLCSYGNALRITGNKSYEQVLINTAESLFSRYNPTVGCIRSWDFGHWQYPVIIDNMMNLDLLFWASEHTGDSKYADASKRHADITAANHFRSDYSAYHVLDYDTITGKCLSAGTFHGYSDSSAWGRGQAWALYGYTLLYRETGELKYLTQAQNIANFIMNHKNMTEDKIPYWDYDAPEIPNEERDASSAAIQASALFQLSAMMEDGTQYFDYAEQIIKTLSSPKYLAKKGSNMHFILMHCVGVTLYNSEIDVPLIYADYYYLEALQAYATLKGIDTSKLLRQ
jgi:rhamnogalacturonyl hydrolase YesR